jgi:VanZ family protein
MKNNLAWSRVYALAVVIIILAGSSVPGKKIPEVFTLTPDKLIHCLEYAVLGFFLFRWLRLEYIRHTLFKISLLTLLLGSLMGVLDENYQRLTPGRSPDFWDWVLDSVGVLIAVILMNYLAKGKSQKVK